MTCTFCTDDVRVKVPSFQKVTQFFQYKYSAETLSVYVFVYLKIFLTAVIEEEEASKVLLQSKASFLPRDSMKTNTISSLIIEIQL